MSISWRSGGYKNCVWKFVPQRTRQVCEEHWSQSTRRVFDFIHVGGLTDELADVPISSKFLCSECSSSIDIAVAAMCWCGLVQISRFDADPERLVDACTRTGSVPLRSLVSSAAASRPSDRGRQYGIGDVFGFRFLNRQPVRQLERVTSTSKLWHASRRCGNETRGPGCLGHVLPRRSGPFICSPTIMLVYVMWYFLLMVRRTPLRLRPEVRKDPGSLDSNGSVAMWPKHYFPFSSTRNGGGLVSVAMLGRY